MSDAAEIKKTIRNAKPRRRKDRKKEDAPRIYIPTGSTVLNLACSDRIDGGFGGGKVVNLIGDSSAGKSVLALTCLAECSRDEKFDDYDLHYKDIEMADAFDYEYLFGSKAAKRILRDPNPPDTIEDLFRDILKKIESGKPFIYVADSHDALTAIAEKKRATDLRDKGDIAGSYKTEKPRVTSELLRVCKAELGKSQSALIIISQTRDNLGFGAMFQPKVRSGGKALKFYSTHEIWLSVVKRHKSKKIEIGSDVEAKITKNKLTGKRRSARFPIYYDYGADDITSCIDYLVESGIWSKKGAKISAPDIEMSCRKSKLIEVIEEGSLEQEIREIVFEAWKEQEEGLKLNRKPRF